MEYLTIEQQLFEKQQKGENTDCSFVFKITTEEGKMTEKIIHGHKILLSAASKYFEVNFKAEWDGNKPILITSFDWIVFDKLIRAIYLSEVTFETLEEAIDIYEAAHFYQIERVLELLRNAIQGYFLEKKTVEISPLAKIAWKFQDYKLIPFVSKYFCANTDKIIKNDDFMGFSTEAINWLFQYDDLSANEIDLVKALEKYLQTNKDVTKSMIKPAIEKIRFLAIKDEEFAKTTLLTQTEKDFLRGKINVNFSNLSKSKCGRKTKTFFAQLPDNIKLELADKLSFERCWVCKQYHSVVCCSKVKQLYHAYHSVQNYWNSVKLNDMSSSNLSAILRSFQQESKTKVEFSSFANIDDVLRNIQTV
ncbi:uncharacterized protein LOC134836851 [Culicoides brevitarsis]|uniref:uncharacterized protein LOC134836851 n=1 Tax=Culicoides brevitarsis TaxID=469753 RepID=UPI00307BBB73